MRWPFRCNWRAAAAGEGVVQTDRREAAAQAVAAEHHRRDAAAEPVERFGFGCVELVSRRVQQDAFDVLFEQWKHAGQRTGEVELVLEQPLPGKFRLKLPERVQHFQNIVRVPARHGAEHGFRGIGGEAADLLRNEQAASAFRGQELLLAQARQRAVHDQLADLEFPHDLPDRHELFAGRVMLQFVPETRVQFVGFQTGLDHTGILDDWFPFVYIIPYDTV